MSGHSKWSTIKRKKGANDAQRAKEFTKIGRLITVAAQNGGGDMSVNPALALAIEKARGVNMPNDNIERAIKRGTGEGGINSDKLEELAYEGYGPLNVALIIDCTTDNRNRTVNEIRSLMEKHGGRMVENGAISWQFDTQGRILIEFESHEEKENRENKSWKIDANAKQKLRTENLENFELKLYDMPGINDVITDHQGIEIRTEASKLNEIKKAIENQGILVSEAELIKVSNSVVELTDAELEKVEHFIELIEANDDVQKVWVNARV